MTDAVGIFGGSGLYELLEGAEEVHVETPFGPPSDNLHLGEIAGRRVAFMPRHGRGHTIPPHRINFRANLYAMHQAGVRRVIGPCAVGSLQAEVAPGHIAVSSQLVDRTWGRPDTFWDGPQVSHVSLADPYCGELRALAAGASEESGVTVHRDAVMVVIQGPRFSTKAESRWYRGQGWHVIGMTGYPEAALARELGMCYVSIGLVTDYDSGLEGSPEVAPVSHQEVLRVFADNIERIRGILFRLVASLPDQPGCDCASVEPLPEYSR